MGILLELYHNPQAEKVVNKLNEANTTWWKEEGQIRYREIRKELGIHKNGDLPVGSKEIVFESKIYLGFYPTVTKVGNLNNYLATHGLTPLSEIFGFKSSEPEASYIIPDWFEVLVRFEEVMPSVTTGSIANLDYNFKIHMEALQEMAEWVIEQKEPNHYYMHWGG